MKKYLEILLALSFSSSLWAGATFSRAHNWVDLEVLTASDLNNEFNNILNNLDPAGVDDYSLTLSQMQTTVDPYPAAVESLATDLKGEIERLRYQILQLKKAIQTTDSTYWYQDAPTSGIFSINGTTVTTTGTSILSGPNTTISGNLELNGTMIHARRIGAGNLLVLRSATYTQITFNDEIVDRKSEFASDAFTTTQAGYYGIQCQVMLYVNYGASTPFRASIRILKNGSLLHNLDDTSVFPGSSSGVGGNSMVAETISGIFYLVPGDVITLDAQAYPDLNVSISYTDTGALTSTGGTNLMIWRIP